MPESIFAPDDLARYTQDAVLEQVAPEAKPKDSMRLPRWLALLGANAADALTTSSALKRGAHEQNPLMKGLAGNPTGLLLTKLGIGAGESLLMDLIAKSRPKVANGVGFGIAGATGAIAANNARQGKK